MTKVVHLFASAAALALATPAIAAAPPTGPVPLDIRATTLSDALDQLARQARIQLMFSPELVRGKPAPAVVGRFTPAVALARLLDASGLIARQTGGRGFVLVALPDSGAARPIARAGAGAALRPVAFTRTAAQTSAMAPSAQAASAPPQDAGPATVDAVPPDQQAQPSEDIVVIGTAGGGIRRQDAAVALTTLSAAAIDQAAPTSVADLFKAIPGISSESSGGQNGANIFVRGYPSGGDAVFVTLQTEGLPFFPPASLSFLDNTQLIRIDETLKRVEAVRGGTGALFASGQPGLTVNFVQVEGGRDFSGLAKVSGTTFGEIRGDAVIAGPLGPDTSFMVGGFYAQSDGIRDTRFTSEKGGQITANLRHDFGRGSVLLFGRYLNDHGQWLLPIPVVQDGRKLSSYPGFDAGTGTFLGPDTRYAVFNDGTRADAAKGRGADVFNLGFNADFEVTDGVTLRDRASYLSGGADTIGLVPSGTPPQSAASYAAGLGGTIASLTYATGAGGGAALSGDTQIVPVGFWVVEKDVRAFVNDAAIEFKTGRNTLTGGVFYADYHSDDRWNLGNAQLLTAESNARRLNLTIQTPQGVTQQATRDGFLGGAFFAVNARYDGRDLAFYAVDELQLTDALRLDGGVRYQHHSVDGLLENATTITDVDGNPNTLYDRGISQLNGSFSTLRYRGDAWAWTAGANYAFTRQLGAFARYSRGNSFPFFDNLRDGLDATAKVDSYEVGVKASLAPLDLYLTLFRNKFDGLQATQILNGAPVASTGGAKTNGVELEGALRPFRGFDFGFSATYLDANYVNYFSNNGTIDNTGNQVQRQPSWRYRVTPAYTLEFGGDAKATVFASLTYTGDRFSDIENRQTLPKFYELDAGVTVDLSRRIQLQATADNLTDELAITEGNPRIIGEQGAGTILARPILGRSFRFSAAYKF